MQALANSGGWRLRVIEAGSEADLDRIFATLAQERAGAFLMATDSTFGSRRNQIAELASRYAIPGISALRNSVEAGGLISYGPIDSETYRQVGIYVGRIRPRREPQQARRQCNRRELLGQHDNSKAVRDSASDPA
jgi:putative ABC transport system substrate-binding protein